MTQIEEEMAAENNENNQQMHFKLKEGMSTSNGYEIFSSLNNDEEEFEEDVSSLSSDEDRE